jgi:copper chaperone
LLYTPQGYIEAGLNDEGERGTMSAQRVYSVPDVSCEHCVSAITGELTQIDGVEDVKVDLESKTVTVTASESVAEDRIREGIDEAGFDIAE